MSLAALRSGAQTRWLPYLHPDIETMPRADLERLQEARLMTMIGIAHDRAPLIRDVWTAAGVSPTDIRSIADFKAKAPFIAKDSLRRYRDQYRDIFGGVNAGRARDLKAIGTTSGTTGDPTPVPRGTRSLSDIGGAREWWMCGVRPGDYAAHLLFTFRGGLRYRVHREAGIIPIYFQHSPSEVPRLIEASRRYRPTLIRTLSSPLINALEQHFEHTGDDPVEALSSYRSGIFGGEALSDRKRRLLQSWGIELFENTALGEICGAVECPMHDGMHIHEDFALAECLDPNGDQPVAEGELGELVVTSLLDPLNALIRFRTDDLVTLTREACGCGRTFARFKPQGRKGDLIEVQGQRILPRYIQGLVEAVPACRAGLFQIIRAAEQMDVLRLRIGYDDSRPQSAGLASELTDRIATALGLPVSVELIEDSVLLKQGPPHKIPRVTQN